MNGPDELRKKVGQIWGAESTRILNEICQAVAAAADAWELDINLKHIASDQVGRVIEQNADLYRRLEAAEKFIRWLPREAWDVGDGPRLRRAALAGEAP